MTCNEKSGDVGFGLEQEDEIYVSIPESSDCALTCNGKSGNVGSGLEQEDEIYVSISESSDCALTRSGKSGVYLSPQSATVH